MIKVFTQSRSISYQHCPGSVGQRDLYPFAILFRELSVEHNEELIRRAMRWPDPLAEQVGVNPTLVSPAAK